jgi:hypothetical protein
MECADMRAKRTRKYCWVELQMSRLPKRWSTWLSVDTEKWPRSGSEEGAQKYLREAHLSLGYLDWRPLSGMIQLR